MLLKADLEARQDTVSPKQVKRYSQSLGKSNPGQESLWANLELQVREKEGQVLKYSIGTEVVGRGVRVSEMSRGKPGH
jgi:hypothetical protein